MQIIELGHEEPLFLGGTRRVYQHPEHRDRCIKVLRHDRTGSARKARKRGWKSLLPASSFDDQRKELQAYQTLVRSSRNLPAVWQLVPEYFGTVATDQGPGIVTRLYRNADGSWPENLEQRLPRGLDAALARALSAFAQGLEQQCVLTRDLLPHNMIVVRCDSGEQQILVVDGIGNADFIPLANYSRWAARAKVRRKLRRLEVRVKMLLPLRDQDGVDLCSS